MKTIFYLVVLIAGLSTWSLQAQQVPDTSRFFSIEDPNYPIGTGPVVFIDAGHHNFHTLDGRYRAFGNILEADGFRVHSHDGLITAESLSECDIFVISNPLHASNVENWALPNPSAFTPEEIAALEEWVEAGGRLFLIADHMPIAGAAVELARAFHFEYLNCFALDQRDRPFDYFTKAAGSLADISLVAGIDSVITFTGSAFAIPADATSVLQLDDEFEIRMPQVAWQFPPSTPTMPGGGLHQLAYRPHGQGKVMVSGEAAMFSAQLAGPDRRPMGLNNPAAASNIDLLRVIMRWLGEE